MTENKVAEQSSYRQILKATSLFGGVQIFNILIQIIRSKMVAVLLGPSGMGVMGLLNSAIGLIGTITNAGLGGSAVKIVAEAHASGDNHRIAEVITVLRRWILLTGLLGLMLTLVFSPWLSQVTFGNREYTLAFIFISITLLINQLSSGQLVLLQGMRELRSLANANMIGAFLGLLVSTPIFYFWRLRGIVPAIIVTSIVSMILSWYFARKLTIEKIQVSRQTTISEGKEMLKMGIVLNLSGLFTIASSYILRIIISNTGGVEQVGLYAAGFAIVETYVGMIFTAMGTDYYPRLSAVNQDINKVRELVGQQAIIALLIIVPGIILFLIYSPVIIQLLYNQQFLSIEKMVNFAMLGMLFKAVSWSMGYILFAKSDSGLFIKTAILFNSLFLINNIAGYKYFGLTGLGLSYLFNFMIHFLALIIITKWRYNFYFNRNIIKILLFSILFCFAGFYLSMFVSPLLKYLFGSIVFIISCIFTLIELNKRISLKETFSKLLSKQGA